MKVREIIKLIKTDGWERIKSKSGHRQYKHPIKKGRVTISGHDNDDIAPKTLQSILRQAQINV